MRFSDDEIIELHELDWSLESTPDEPLPRANRMRRLTRSLLVGLAYGGVAWVPPHVFAHFMTSGWTR